MTESTKARIYANWEYAGLTAGVFLLLLMPLLWTSWPLLVWIVLLQLPMYMIHQVEEHYGDRFRRGVNNEFAHGRDALNRSTVLVINIGAIWIVDMIALYLAYFVRPGLGLIADYLPIVNGTIHVLLALKNRSYNPGLISAVLLLLPVGSLGVWLLVKAHQATIADQVWGLGGAVLIHIMMVTWIYHRVQLVNHAVQSGRNR